jgi:hypothetical protein
MGGTVMREPVEETEAREASLRSQLLNDVLRKEEEEALLLAGGFRPVEGGLWKKDGMWFGREAALQRVRNSGTNS